MPADRQLLQLKGWERLQALLYDPRGRCAADVAAGIDHVDPAGAAWARARCACARCARATPDERELLRVERRAPLLTHGGAPP